MDKKLLLDFSKIIRDIESKNLHKEADALNSCLIRLAQLSDETSTTEDMTTSPAPQTQPTPNEMQTNTDDSATSYSPEFVSDLVNFATKADEMAKKSQDFITSGEFPETEMANLNSLIEKADRLLAMNEATGEDKNKLSKITGTLKSIKSIFTQKS